MGFKKESSSVNYLKIKWLKREEKEHYFEVNWDKVDENVFEGMLVWVEKWSYEYEWVTRHTIKFIFQDNELYQLDIAYNQLGRNLLNSLAWCKKIGKIEMSLYMNKWWFKSMWIKNNWERAEWKLSVEEQKKLVTKNTKKDGTVEMEYFDLNQKLWDEIVKINKLAEKNMVEEVEKDDTAEDLPF
jgi:hypothetical protein